MRKFAAILLAAGASSRMGENKLLLDAGGMPMVRHAAMTCQAAGLAPLIAVLGHQADMVQAALAGLPVRCIRNDDYEAGLSTSLRAGLAAVPAAAQAALIVLADMPLITPQDMKALCAAYAPARRRHICVPMHEGQRGNPVLLGRAVFAALEHLGGDQGAKSFIQAHAHLVVEVPAGPGVLIDLDTPQAYENFRSRMGG